MDTPNWDMIQSAAAYSTLTGILAGFALTSVTVVVTVVTNRRRQLEAKRMHLEMTAGWLITSFFSLLLVSFLFAVLAGHDRFVITVDPSTHQIDYGAKTIQPLVLGLPVSLLFSSAALQLFLGIVWLFELVQLGRLTQLCARVMFWFLIPLSAVHIHSYYGTIEEERTHKAPPLSLQFWGVALVAIAVPLVAFVLTRLLGWIGSARREAREKKAGHEQRNTSAPEKPLTGEKESRTGEQGHTSAPTIQYAPVLAALGLTLIIGISFGFVENLPESTFSDPHLDLTPVIWGVYSFLAVLWTLYVFGLPKNSDNKHHGPPGSRSAGEATQQIMAHERGEVHQTVG